MAPKTQNAKKEQGRAKKAENEGKKKEAASAEKEKKVAAEWEDGAKSSKAKEEKEEKKKAEAARKAENARLLAAEEAALPAKPKPAPKAGKKAAVAQVPAGPGAIAAGGLMSVKKEKKGPAEVDEVAEAFAATGIDDALDLMETITAKTDRAGVGAAAGQIERHPERRFKAAYKEYEEAQLPVLREERPGLRLQQYKDLIFKQFQKAPENPFNQTLVDYDATKEDKVEALNRQRRQVEERLRE